MKKVLFFSAFFTFMLIAGISCTKEEDTPEPSIEFKTGEFKPGIMFISADTALIVDTEFTIGILAESNSAKNITNVTIVRKIDGGTPKVIKDSTTSAQSLDLQWKLKTSATVGFYETFTVEVSDANKMMSSISLTIQTLPSDPGIIVYKNKFLTSFQLDFEHFFSVSNGLTYDTTDCQDQDIQALIDFGYFDHITYGHTFMSTDIEFFHTIYPSVELWPLHKKTRFSKTEISSGAFDAIETIDEFINAIDNAVTEFNLEFTDNTEEGHVIAFKTKNDIRGLLKVNGTQSSPNYGESTITFDVKIEKKE